MNLKAAKGFFTRYQTLPLFQRGITAVASALNFVRASVFNGAPGDRPDVQDACLLITDGDSTDAVSVNASFDSQSLHADICVTGSVLAPFGACACIPIGIGITVCNCNR